MNTYRSSPADDIVMDNEGEGYHPADQAPYDSAVEYRKYMFQRRMGSWTPAPPSSTSNYLYNVPILTSRPHKVPRQSRKRSLGSTVCHGTDNVRPCCTPGCLNHVCSLCSCTCAQMCMECNGKPVHTCQTLHCNQLLCNTCSICGFCYKCAE